MGHTLVKIYLGYSVVENVSQNWLKRRKILIIESDLTDKLNNPPFEGPD